MNNPLRVAVIGTGRRVNLFYCDVLNQLKNEGKIIITAVYNRTESKGQEVAQKLETKYFESLENLVKEAKPQIAIISLPGEIKQKTALGFLARGVNVFLETPMADSVWQIEELKRLAKRNKLRVESAEDFAYFPEAIIQKQIINSGILGKVTEVYNNCAGFAHHGMARFHTLIGKLEKVKKYQSEVMNVDENLSFEKSQIEFNDGLIYKIKFPIPKNHAVRENSTWEITCQKGILDNDKVVFPNNQEIKLSKNYNGENIASIATMIDDHKFIWQSPNSTWSKKQTSLYALLDAFIKSINTGSPLAYGLIKAKKDTRYLNSLRITKKIPMIKSPFILDKLESVLNFYKKIKK